MSNDNKTTAAAHAKADEITTLNSHATIEPAQISTLNSHATIEPAQISTASMGEATGEVTPDNSHATDEKA